MTARKGQLAPSPPAPRPFTGTVDGDIGQTVARQLDGLADIGEALSIALGRPASSLWTMQNGYALCSASGLAAISAHLAKAGAEDIDALRGALCIGLHIDVEVTEYPSNPPVLVSQAFCSALPVAYSDLAPKQWAPFARLVPEAAYEATLCAAAINASRGASNIALLTLLGGGAFGNDNAWIFDAIRRALTIAASFPLDVKIVSYGAPSTQLREKERALSLFERLDIAFDGYDRDTRKIFEILSTANLLPFWTISFLTGCFSDQKRSRTPSYHALFHAAVFEQ